MPIIGSTAGQSGKIPGSVTIDSVTAGDGSVSVAFTEPAYKGKGSITYTATSSPSGITGTSSSSPITVSGLSNGTAYTFTITALSSSGVSTLSSASNSVTPELNTSVAYTGSQAFGSSFNKFTFSSETYSTAGTRPAGVGLDGVGSVSNVGSTLYFAGGNWPANSYQNFSNMYKVTISNDTFATISAVLPDAGFYPHGVSNPGTAGYFQPIITGGGSSTSPQRVWIRKLAFSGETASTLASTFGVAAGNAATGSNWGTAGYFLGSSYGDGDPLVSRIDKLTFSNETRTTLASTISQGVAYGSHGDVSNSGTAAYAFGGYNGAPDTNKIEKVLFSNDTSSVVGTTLPSASRAGNGFSKKGSAGYFNPATGSVSNTLKFVFSNETISTLAVNAGVGGGPSGGAA